MKRISVCKSLRVPVSSTLFDRLEAQAERFKMPVTRLVAIAVENELAKDKPFEDFVVKIPESGTYDEFTFSDEAGKIVNWFRMFGASVTLDQLYIFRHDMHIPDGHTFLAGVRECLDRGMIETFIPKRSRLNDTHFKKNANYMKLRLKKEHKR